MTDDVRLSVSLRRHRKTKRLKRLLGADGCWALVCLFMWVGEERWTGDLSGLSDHDLEEEADWDGQPGALVAALVEVGFMDGDEGSRKIHDWQEHNPYASGKGQRIERSRNAANSRWHKHASSMPVACVEHAHEQCPPTPTPTPTLHTPKEQKPLRSPNGSRLPEDWMCSPEDYGWAINERPDIDVGLEASKFRDYWHSQPGAKGRKVNWTATWRNWVRNAHGVRRGGNAAVQPSKTAQTIMALGGNRNAVDERGNRTGVPAATLPWPGASAGLGHFGRNGPSLDDRYHAQPGMGSASGRPALLGSFQDDDGVSD